MRLIEEIKKLNYPSTLSIRIYQRVCARDTIQHNVFYLLETIYSSRDVDAVDVFFIHIIT